MDDFAVLVARYGLAAMPFLLFLLLDFAGALLWAGAGVALGFAFGEEILVLDLRRDDDYAASDRMVAGAVRVRPASFHRHAHHLPRDRDLVFCCT